VTVEIRSDTHALIQAVCLLCLLPSYAAFSWCDSATGWTLDLRSTGRGFGCRSARGCVTYDSAQVVHTIVSPQRPNSITLSSSRAGLRPSRELDSIMEYGLHRFATRFELSRQAQFNNSSGDEIANVNFSQRHRTCRGQRLRPLNGLHNFYYKYLC